MVSVCTVPARGGRSCEHFGGYKTINRIPLPLPLPTVTGFVMLIDMIGNLYFKSVIILHSKHELPGHLADYKITIQNITYRA